MPNQGREIKRTHRYFASFIMISALMLGSSWGAFAEEPALAATPSASVKSSGDREMTANLEMAMREPQPEVLRQSVRKFESTPATQAREEIGSVSRPLPRQAFGGKSDPSRFDYTDPEHGFFSKPRPNSGTSFSPESNDVRKPLVQLDIRGWHLPILLTNPPAE